MKLIPRSVKRANPSMTGRIFFPCPSKEAAKGSAPMSREGTGRRVLRHDRSINQWFPTWRVSGIPAAALLRMTARTETGESSQETSRPLASMREIAG